MEAPWKLNIELPHDPVMPLCGVGTKVSALEGNPRSSVTAAQGTTAKIWSHPRFPSMDDGEKNGLEVHNGLLASYKKNKIVSFTGKWIGIIMLCQHAGLRMTSITSFP